MRTFDTSEEIIYVEANGKRHKALVCAGADNLYTVAYSGEEGFEIQKGVPYFRTGMKGNYILCPE